MFSKKSETDGLDHPDHLALRNISALVWSEGLIGPRAGTNCTCRYPTDRKRGFCDYRN
jgi:hypothetical protein